MALNPSERAAMEERDGRGAYEFGDFRVDAVQRLLLLKADGRPLPLVSRAFETLLYFVQHHGELLDKATLMKAVWPDAIVDENNLNQSITAIRRALGENPGEHRFIVTVPGRGYRFVAEVRTVTAQPSGAETAPPAAQSQDAPAKVDPEVIVAPVASAGRRSRERLAWIGALAALTLALAASLIFALRPSPPASEMHVEITTPPTAAPTSLAISPDGRTIAFVATFEDQSQLWLRSLESGSARPLPGTDGALSPFWSPDSRSLGFFAGGKLKRVDVAGGPVRTLANASRGRSGAWSRDGTILFAMLGTPIFRVSDTGGEPIAVTRLEGQPGSHFAPQFLPDHRHFLYWVRGSSKVSGVYVGQLGRSQSRRLFDADAGATYMSSGQLLFLRQGTLFAQEFDPLRLELTGKPFPVAEQVASGAQSAGVSVSGTGSIAYRASSAISRRQFVWFDRSGKEMGNVGDSVSAVTGLSNPSLSLDGQRVALYQLVNGNADISLLETRRGVFSRFTSDIADD